MLKFIIRQNGVYQYTEIGYNFFMLFVHLFNGNQQLVFFVTALLTNVFIGFFILYFSNEIILSSILYYTFSFFLIDLALTVCQYLAISIFALSLIYLK
ncbi:MAG: EpsG family protein [Halanaerobiales bacterium]|nr:EpsG family protein [Halanaerobiales bacterium]